MRVQVMSDLHLDFKHENLPLISEESDVLVIAGDVGPDTEDFAKFITNYVRDFTEVPILMVLGNHDYYGKVLNSASHEFKNELQGVEDVYVLDNASVILNGVKFVGTTLWTDFDKRSCEMAATINMPDYAQIKKLGDHYELVNVTTQDIYNEYEKNVEFLEKELSTGLRVAVVTHHVPSYKFVDPVYRNSRLNGAFYANLDNFIFNKSPHTWICGHTHRNFSGSIGETMIYCNPYGYPFERYQGYAEELVIEI